MIPFVNLANPLPTTPGTGLTAGQEAALTTATRRQPVASIAALKALTPSAGDAVNVLGYSAAGDGGGGTFFYDSASVVADNGGTVIAPNAGGGRWIRVYSGPVNVRWFGAKGDYAPNPGAGTDDLVAIQAAIDLAGVECGSVFFPVGHYSVGGPLVISRPIRIFGEKRGYDGDIYTQVSYGSQIVSTSTTSGHPVLHITGNTGVHYPQSKYIAISDIGMSFKVASAGQYGILISNVKVAGMTLDRIVFKNIGHSVWRGEGADAASSNISWRDVACYDCAAVISDDNLGLGQSLRAWHMVMDNVESGGTRPNLAGAPTVCFDFTSYREISGRNLVVQGAAGALTHAFLIGSDGSINLENIWEEVTGFTGYMIKCAGNLNRINIRGATFSNKLIEVTGSTTTFVTGRCTGIKKYDATSLAEFLTVTSGRCHFEISGMTSTRIPFNPALFGTIKWSNIVVTGDDSLLIESSDKEVLFESGPSLDWSKKSKLLTVAPATWGSATPPTVTIVTDATYGRVAKFTPPSTSQTGGLKLTFTLPASHYGSVVTVAALCKIDAASGSVRALYPQDVTGGRSLSTANALDTWEWAYCTFQATDGSEVVQTRHISAPSNAAALYVAKVVVVLGAHQHHPFAAVDSDQPLFLGRQTAAPATGDYVVGDWFDYTAPSAGGSKGMVYTAGGWKSFGAISA